MDSAFSRPARHSRLPAYFALGAILVGLTAMGCKRQGDTAAALSRSGAGADLAQDTAAAMPGPDTSIVRGTAAPKTDTTAIDHTQTQRKPGHSRHANPGHKRHQANRGAARASGIPADSAAADNPSDRIPDSSRPDGRHPKLMHRNNLQPGPASGVPGGRPTYR